MAAADALIERQQRQQRQSAQHGRNGAEDASKQNEADGLLAELARQIRISEDAELEESMANRELKARRTQFGSGRASAAAGLAGGDGVSADAAGAEGASGMGAGGEQRARADGD